MVDAARRDELSGWSGSAQVARGREVLAELGVGPVAAPDGPRCGPSTCFQAGSISKLVLSAVVLALVARATPPHRAGERFRYSGPGFLVAAGVVEAVTGRPYGEVAAELVLTPAGLGALAGLIAGGPSWLT